MEYYIFVSNDCNLNCSYCSVLLKMENSTIPKEPMYSLDTLNRFIDSTQRQYNDNTADIVFFGGEPTLNYSFIQELISSQNLQGNLPYKYHYMLHTNGLLLNDIPEDILNHLNSIMLSINYDKVPRLRLDNSYFQSIVDSVHTIKQRHSIPVVARLTITEETSLYSEIALFNPFFDAIYWQLENKYFFNNFALFYASYKYELSLTFNTWLNYLKKGVVLRLIPFMAATYFSMNNHSTDAFCCGYNNSMIYVQTNGHCYTCAEDMTTNKNLIGEIVGGIKFESFGPKDTICKSCPYLQMCIGRCGRMHREFSNDHVQKYCKLNRLLFDLIYEHLNEIQQCCKDYGIAISLDDPIYHYTEYTP